MRNKRNTAEIADTQATDKKLKLDYGQTFKVGLAFAGVCILAFFLYRRLKKVRSKLAMAISAKYEMDDFLTQF